MTSGSAQPGEGSGVSRPAPQPGQEAMDGRDMMLAVAADAPGAFERLVATYEPRVKAAVARSIRDRSSVDDLAQEVFLRLYRARERYQPTAKFETFLYRIIFNLCVNHTQYSNRRRHLSLFAPRDEHQDGPGLALPADPAAVTPDERVAEGERAVLVRRAIDTLPDNQRRALVLSRYEGLGYEEIGEVMSLSLQAVKSLLWRARDNVRRSLLPLLGDPTDD